MCGLDPDRLPQYRRTLWSERQMLLADVIGGCYRPTRSANVIDVGDRTIEP